MRHVIGIDVHRTFGEVVLWEGGILRHAGRVDMKRIALCGLLISPMNDPSFGFAG